MPTEVSSSRPSRFWILKFSHKTHKWRSTLIIGLFVIYLPIVYQIHLDIVEGYVAVNVMGPGLFWMHGGYRLFPIPFDSTWISPVVLPAIMPLNSIDAWAYYNFVSNILLRVAWSLMWLTIGLVYVIWPLLGRFEGEVK